MKAADTIAGTISVSSTPTGAPFTLSGPANYTGTTPLSKTDAPAGAYTITWGAMSGYTAPPSETKTLTQGGSISFSGTYQAVQVIDAWIVSYSPSSATTVTVGNSVNLSVTFTNTGNTAWQFIAGATVWN